MKIENISVVGLGKLGFPFAVCLVHKGFKVTAVDEDKERVELLNRGEVPFYEPGLKELLALSRHNLKGTTDYGIAVKNSRITFIVVPTPSDSLGDFSLKCVLQSCKQTGEVLKKKKDFHLVVVTSTVTPGSMDREIKPALSVHSGKRCKDQFGLCYNPEFIALGRVVHNLYNPDFILIGESDRKSGDILSSLYGRFCGEDKKIARMNFVNAELTKLLVNTFVTMKISYANMIERLCELLTEGDVDVVTKALGLDKRIGPEYLKGGLGYGGPCFPRDNVALACAARKVGSSVPLAEATHKFNQDQIYRVVDMVLAKLPEKGKVGILGLSYKPDTDVVEESQGLLLARIMMDKNVPVILYDPVAAKKAKKALGLKVNIASSVRECIKEAQVLVIATAWDEFTSISPDDFKGLAKRAVIDCWRILNRDNFLSLPVKETIEYVPLGIGPKD